MWICMGQHLPPDDSGFTQIPGAADGRKGIHTSSASMATPDVRGIRPADGKASEAKSVWAHAKSLLD